MSWRSEDRSHLFLRVGHWARYLGGLSLKGRRLSCDPGASVPIQPLPTRGPACDRKAHKVNLWTWLLADEARALTEAWPTSPESTWPRTVHRGMGSGAIWSRICCFWSGGFMRAVTAKGDMAPGQGSRKSHSSLQVGRGSI